MGASRRRTVQLRRQACLALAVWAVFAHCMPPRTNFAVAIRPSSRSAYARAALERARIAIDPSAAGSAASRPYRQWNGIDPTGVPAPSPSLPLSAAVPVAFPTQHTSWSSIKPANSPQSDAAELGPWLSAGHVDYAPSGLPDVSQCRGSWSVPGAPPQWTHAGPVALADVLWWLDSVAEPNGVPPPTVSDGYSLVTAYPVFGPQTDDHDRDNLTMLIEDLALRAHTNGAGLADPVSGTRWSSLVAATRDYLSDRRLDRAYAVQTTELPTLTWLDGRVRSGAGVVVLLGVWEHQGTDWRRIGGHYAGVAGADSVHGWVALADPLLDGAAHGGMGHIVPDDPARHSCREAPRDHDDAAVVSHDVYDLYAVPGLPDGRSALAGYFSPATFGEAAAYRDLNPADFLAAHSGRWSRGSVVMVLDAALGIVPASAELPTTAPAATEPPAAGTTTAQATHTPTTPPSGTTTAQATHTPTTPPSGTTAIPSPTGAPTRGAAPTPVARDLQASYFPFVWR